MQSSLGSCDVSLVEQSSGCLESGSCCFQTHPTRQQTRVLLAHVSEQPHYPAPKITREHVNRVDAHATLMFLVGAKLQPQTQ